MIKRKILELKRFRMAQLFKLRMDEPDAFDYVNETGFYKSHQNFETFPNK